MWKINLHAKMKNNENRIKCSAKKIQNNILERRGNKLRKGNLRTGKETRMEERGGGEGKGNEMSRADEAGKERKGSETRE